MIKRQSNRLNAATVKVPIFYIGSVRREGTSLGFFSLNFVILKIGILEKIEN
jgi:hypothetical protein